MYVVVICFVKWYQVFVFLLSKKNYANVLQGELPLMCCTTKTSRTYNSYVISEGLYPILSSFTPMAVIATTL